MSHIEVTYILDDTTEANYNYDSDKIEFTSGGAKLKLVDNSAQVFNQPFTSGSGFTYNASLTEFVAGKCQQKDLWPGADAAADYASSIDLSWGGGSLTGTATGGAAVSIGELDLAHDDVRYVDYSAAGNADSTQVGAVKVKFRPNYSGTPSSIQSIIHMGEDGNQNNQITIAHITGTGKLRIVFFDTVGGLISTTDLGVFNPTSGVPYEIELNWDLTTGAQRLFLDGTQSGLTDTTTGTRNASSIMRIGSNFSATTTSNFKADDLIFFPTVQHTTDYTPGYDVWKYKEDLITLPTFTYSGLGVIQQYTNFTTTQTGAMKMNVNGKWWNGAIWTTSNDSYAEMNDPTTIAANIGTLSPLDTVDVKIRTTDNHTQQDIDVLDVTYTGQHYPIDNPTIEIKSGVLSDGIHGWHETDVTTPGGTVLKYILPRAPALYWSGAAWVSSNETYAQSNTGSEILTNLGTLDITGGNTVKFLTFLNSDGSATPIIKTLDLEYDFYSIIPLPNHVTIFSQSIDIGANLLEDTTVSVNSYAPFMHGNNIVMIDVSAQTGANGVFELDVVETETVNKKVFVTLEHVVGEETTTVIYDNIEIPDVVSVSLETLLTDKVPNDIKYYKEGTVQTAGHDSLYLRGIFEAIP